MKGQSPPMNARQRFHNTMHYLPRDRSPSMDVGFWRETLISWEQYGFPKEGNPDALYLVSYPGDGTTIARAWISLGGVKKFLLNDGMNSAKFIADVGPQHLNDAIGTSSGVGSATDRTMSGAPSSGSSTTSSSAGWTTGSERLWSSFRSTRTTTFSDCSSSRSAPAVAHRSTWESGTTRFARPWRARSRPTCAGAEPGPERRDCP